ncbi:MAG: cysteine--tRNA ligase, partial [Aquificaceae bacterium]
SKQDLSAYEFATQSIIKHMRGIFGLFEDLRPRHRVMYAPVKEIDENLINLLVEVRNMTRMEKIFKIADYIRDKLTDLGIVLEDTPAGTRWRKL